MPHVHELVVRASAERGRDRRHTGCDPATCAGRRRARVLTASLGASALLAAVPTAASALTGAGTTSRPPTAATGGQASLRAADLSPDTAAVVISLRPMSGGSSMALSGAASYGQAGAYRQVAAGRYQVSLRQGSGSAALLTWDFQAQPGAAYTVAAVGKGQQRRGVVLRDDLTPPARGTARVRLIQAASVAAKADVTADGTITLARNAPFPSVTGYAQVPAGTWPVAATAGGTTSLTTQTKVSLQPGSVTSLLLLDAPGGGLTLRSAVDSVGTATTPKGGVNTGGGGTATSFVGGVPASGGATPGSAVEVSLAVAGGLALAGGTALAGARRQRRRRSTVVAAS